ncbi:MAG: ABC transporter permease [Fusobacteriota bacterium]
MVEFFIAKKHILERTRQSVLAIIGIAIGMIVLLVSLAISNGLNKNMIDSILSMTSHIKISNHEVSIEDYDNMQKKVDDVEGVTGAIPQYETQGILKFNGDFGSYVSGVVINGVTQNDAINVLNFDEKIVEGELDFSSLSSVIIGKPLFEQIGAKLGEQVKVISPENKELYLTIVGVYESGFYEYDSTLLIMPLKTVQILSNSGDSVTNINVKINNVYKAKEIEKVINQKIPDITTNTWGELNQNLLYALSLEKTVMVIVLSLIIIISGFVVGVILNTSVREKTKDIGVLRATGYSKISVMKIFFLEGISLGVLGIILGNVLSLGLIEILKRYSKKIPLDAYYLKDLPVEIGFYEFYIISLATMVIIILSSVYPAYRASKLKPVEALKYE